MTEVRVLDGAFGKTCSRLAVAMLLTSLCSAGVVASGCSGGFTSCQESHTCIGSTRPPNGDGGAGANTGVGGDDSVPSKVDAGGASDTANERTTAGQAGAEDDANAEGGMATAQPTASCGDGKVDLGEECDLGAQNSRMAYGRLACSYDCKKAPFCGDMRTNGPEVCDEGGLSNELGRCNPECTGYYEKKYIRTTFNSYVAGALGGISGADAKCVLEFGEGWKALLVGGGRRATVNPLLGDGAKDWVIQKYTHYYSYHEDKLVWRTDELALLGVRGGKRVNVYADAFAKFDYPWSGWLSDWTTVAEGTPDQGTCASWTSADAAWGTFSLSDLTLGASEQCTSSARLACVEQ